ncbi:ABC transporter substrate-binding protein [Nocardioides nitrophenolicus]|uniref:ABC transporter substrate-binding protein n=1 Tax=Nocardioides nitrophenolicus TaxID=60489 RepID=UPI00195B054B|nr:ABC transporter substrate-binding protein [Nocardioides nitrophenolicus]MBM7515876.1 iron complex transport system substrate-binding protein [Nocardioides nitrophenolicus]
MRRPLAVLAASASVLALTSCGLGASERSASGGSGPYPVTVENCGAEVTFDAAPEEVVLLKSAAVPYLARLGVLDRVTARAGEYPRDYYDDATWAALEDIPALTGKTDASGHLLISKEVVIDQEPDLVLGEIDNLGRDTLGAVGIPLIEEPAMCPRGLDDPGFDDITDQMSTYGEVFDRRDEATAANAAIEQRVAELSAPAGGERRTAAVLYPTVGGGVTYAYGARSMAHPILEAAGLDDVFADTDERVFEVTAEELIGRDPDVLVLLHSAGDPDQVVAAVTGLPGADSITAVREGELLPLLFNYVEPPTPLALDGLAQVRARFAS